MATNALQDVLAGYSMECLHMNKTCILKLIVLLCGILTVAFALLSQYLTGPVTQMCNTAFGAAGGPVVGIFFLGSVFPQANKKGAFVGGISGIAINMWIAIGSFLYGRKAPLSKLVNTSGCIQNETYLPELNTTLPPISYQQNVEDNHIAIYDLSYVWFGLIGFLWAVIIGLAVSFITGKNNDHPTEPMYISPFLRRIWTFDESTLHGNQATENCYPLIHKEEPELVAANKETPIELID